MSSIDRRVVEMEFDNRQFERGIKDTLNSLEALKKGLTLEGATKGLKGVEEASKRFSLAGIAEGVDNISNRFSALGAIGFTIIQNLTNAAISYAKKLSGLVLDPLVAGGKRRAQNIEQAKFMFRGLEMDIEEAMANALYAVKGTAFGLDEAARAASQLGASQVELGDDMRTALRGISGVAAMTNSSYEDTARIFTRVAGQGRVMAVDLNSIAARGLNAAATLGDAMGISEAEVREMVTQGKISFEMFASAMDEAFGENATKANETYSGSLANLRAAMSRIGASFFGKHLENQRDIFNALTPVVDALGDALAPVIDLMLDFSAARATKLINFFENIDLERLALLGGPFAMTIRNIIDALQSIIKPIQKAFREIFPQKSLKDAYAFLLVIQSFTYRLKIGEESADKLRRTFAGVFAVFSIGWTVIKTIARALGELFGVVFEGSGGFLTATANIGDFLVALDEAIKKGTGLSTFFGKLVEILKPPIRFMKALARAIFSVFDFDAPSADRLSKTFEAFQPLGRLGDMIMASWQRLGRVLRIVWEFFQPVAARIGSFFGDFGKIVVDAFATADFQKVVDIIQTGLFASILLLVRRFGKDLGGGFGSGIHRLTGPFAKLTFTLTTMQNTLRALTLMQIAIAVGLLTASVVALSGVDAAGLGKSLSAISVMMAQLVAAMKLMGALPGGIIGTGTGLILVATALRILVSSVKSMAKLSWEDIAKGLSGVTALLAALSVSVQLMAGQTGGMVRAGIGLMILSAGIKILASAVTDLSGLDWQDMAKGLVGVGTLLASLAIFTKLTATTKSGVLQGAGLLLLATGIRVLASAVEVFASLSWQDISKGLASITAILTAFAIFSMVLNPSGLIRAGISLVLIGAAMQILASAIGKFGAMSWGEISKGLGAMAGALVAIVLALNLMPPSTIASAAALVLVSFALGQIAKAMGQMGGMSWEEIGKGLVVLAGSLGIIAVAMMLMTSALAGAAATFIVASALRILAPVIRAFGNMSIGEIAKGLGVLAGMFVVLGIAGLVLAPVVPAIIGLGLAVMLLGAGMMLAGAGLLAFSIGLTALAAAGAAGVGAMVAIVAGLIGLIPMLAHAIGELLMILLKIIRDAAPLFLEALSAILGAVLDAIAENVPKMIETFGDLALQLVQKLEEIVPPMAAAALSMMLGILEELEKKAPDIVAALSLLIVTMLKAMTKEVPKFVTAATDLIVAFLRGIERNVGRIITAGTDVIIAFIRGIARNALRLANAAADTLVDFLNGLARAIRVQAPRIRAAGKNIASAIVSGLTGGLTDAIGRTARAARNLASSALDGAKRFLRISSPSLAFEELGIFSGEGMAKGMSKTAPIIGKAAEGVGEEAVNAMKKSMSGMSDILAMDTDLHPTITPILDLSEFDKRAAKIGDTLSDREISVDMSYEKARDASSRYTANEAAKHQTSTEGEVTPQQVLNYTQNNTSPKALSPAEIYRQTKNQLATTKGALTP